MTGGDYILAGVVMILVGIGAMLDARFTFRAQYKSLEWLSELPHHGCLMSWVAFLWLTAAVVGVLYIVSRGHLSIAGYILAVAMLAIGWWVRRTRIARFMEQTVASGLESYKEEHSRRYGIALIVIGWTLITIGLFKSLGY